MSQPFVGEIRLFGGNFAPSGWMFCNGQLLSIAQYEVLFVLIGTTYGGDGVQTFALPNLQSRLPIHMGTGGGGTYVQGQTGGVENVVLNASQIPSHTHTVTASSDSSNSSSPSGNYLAAGPDIYEQNKAGDALMAATSISNAGGNQPHDNLQPFLCVSYIISLFGIFPSRN
jgi:microcystin-dependent protein